ncbi:hypothetical protein [Burkholderia multivorans]|uniref:hypothetical protein n=1 Tax=Burkholderia multivorans TaxID=87883 RepID=UPI001C242269|nr:hypothetical protein [Burkholderia multivorans]MBU9605518.1 hypothetical protein [Burkholderia multivorans]MBU9624966.1 hypothetical protein [Burkholderia multivorans]
MKYRARWLPAHPAPISRWNCFLRPMGRLRLWIKGRQMFALLSDPLGIGWTLLSLPLDEYLPTSLLVNLAYV